MSYSSRGNGLSWPVAKYAGDALWNLVVSLRLGFALPAFPTRVAVGLAAFAGAVELG